jgi:branched-chain amino acid transport system ATP-binding protein
MTLEHPSNRNERTNTRGEVILKVEHLESGYDEFVAFRDVNVIVLKGEIASIIGPNGAGKTTLLKTIIGALKPFKGRVVFKAKDITGIEPREAARGGIAYVPAGTGTFPGMTVYENIEAGGFILKDRDLVEERIEEVMKLFPRLRERQHNPASTLSGGERQALLLGRALMIDPDLVLMDEPSLGLDPKAQNTLYSSIIALNQRQGKSVLLVEQNVERALNVSARCYVMDAGRIVHEGTPQQLSNMKDLREAYLGISSRPKEPNGTGISSTG